MIRHDPEWASAMPGHDDPDPRLPVFRWRTRVYWEDTDAGGVVYHANYLRFLERARTEWMRAGAMGQTTLRQRYGIVFVVRELGIAYDKPARLDDELEATVQVERLRSASMDIVQQVLRVAGAVTLARATVRIACVDAQAFKPRRIPRDLAALIDRDAVSGGSKPA